MIDGAVDCSLAAVDAARLEDLSAGAWVLTIRVGSAVPRVLTEGRISEWSAPEVAEAPIAVLLGQAAPRPTRAGVCVVLGLDEVEHLSAVCAAIRAGRSSAAIRHGIWLEDALLLDPGTGHLRRGCDDSASIDDIGGQT